MNKDLDTLLNKRAAPGIPEGMNARIIAEAARTEQIRGTAKRTHPFGAFTRVLDGIFPAYQPAWAVAAAVVLLALGFVIGDLVDIGLVDSSASDGGQLSSFMSVEDSFSVQEWV